MISLISHSQSCKPIIGLLFSLLNRIFVFFVVWQRAAHTRRYDTTSSESRRMFNFCVAGTGGLRGEAAKKPLKGAGAGVGGFGRLHRHIFPLTPTQVEPEADGGAKGKARESGKSVNIGVTISGVFKKNAWTCLPLGAWVVGGSGRTRHESSTVLGRN